MHDSVPLQVSIWVGSSEGNLRLAWQRPSWRQTNDLRASHLLRRGKSPIVQLFLGFHAVIIVAVIAGAKYYVTLFHWDIAIAGFPCTYDYFLFLLRCARRLANSGKGGVSRDFTGRGNRTWTHSKDSLAWQLMRAFNFLHINRAILLILKDGELDLAWSLAFLDQELRIATGINIVVSILFCGI